MNQQGVKLVQEVRSLILIRKSSLNALVHCSLRSGWSLLMWYYFSGICPLAFINNSLVDVWMGGTSYLGEPLGLWLMGLLGFFYPILTLF